jgi:hypothetical protein
MTGPAPCFGCVEQPGLGKRPAPSRSGSWEPRESGEQGGCGCIFAERVLWVQRARGGCWLRCAPRAPRSPASLSPAVPTSRPIRCAAQSAPPAPSRRGAGRGCGTGGTSDSVLGARRLHGAQCHCARARSAQSAAGPPSRQGDAARARAPARPLTARVRTFAAAAAAAPLPRRQWTREPLRRSTVGAAPVAAPPGPWRVDARGRRCP